MKWLFWQTWMLLLASFLIGAFITWLFFVRLRSQLGVAGVMSIPAVAPIARILGARTGSSGSAPAVTTPTPLSDAPAPEPPGSPDLDTPAIGIPVTTPVEPRKPDGATGSDDGGFGGNSDDTLVLAADVAAGRPEKPAPYPKGVLPLTDGAAPSAEFVIKGETDSMLYHGPASPSYRQTTAEVWFRDEDDAQDAGFRPWDWRDRVTGGLPRLDAHGRPVAGAVVDPADAAALAAMAGDQDDAVTESPYGPGSALPVPGGSAPSSAYRIKGNADSMLYHTADSPYFARTRPEVWFRTEEDAVRAGFHPWNRRARQAARNTRLLAGPAFEEGRYPGSAKPHNGGTAPSAEFIIKGNESSMVYHTSTSPFFGATVAEVWFRSEADAQRAGFTPWYAKARTP